MPNNPELNVASKYGAPMGRHCGAVDYDAEGKFTLRAVRLDQGGYDAGGAYWGHSQTLYYFASEDGTAEGYFRADCRNAAKRHILNDFPQAKFYS